MHSRQELSASDSLPTAATHPQAWVKEGGAPPTLHLSDSAHATDGSEEGDSLLDRPSGHSRVAPFHIAHSGARGAVSACDLV